MSQEELERFFEGAALLLMMSMKSWLVQSDLIVGQQDLEILGCARAAHCIRMDGNGTAEYVFYLKPKVKVVLAAGDDGFCLHWMCHASFQGLFFALNQSWKDIRVTWPRSTPIPRHSTSDSQC